MTKWILITLLSVVGFSAQAATELSTFDALSNDTIVEPAPARPPGHTSYFDWGRGRDGWGYCYQFTPQGYVMNGGRPVPNQNCEYYRPSYFNWGRGMDGWTYCYQWTPYGAVMNQGRNVPNYYCQR